MQWQFNYCGRIIFELIGGASPQLPQPCSAPINNGQPRATKKYTLSSRQILGRPAWDISLSPVVYQIAW